METLSLINTEFSSALKSKIVVCCLLGMLCIVACDTDDNNNNNTGSTRTVNWASAADSSSRSLVTNFWYAGANRLYFNNNSGAPNDWNSNYWPQAHALDVLVDAYIRTEDIFYLNVMNNWLVGVHRGNGNRWANNFIDDMEWIGLAAFRAWKATGNEGFLTACRDVWDGTTTNMDDNNAAFGIKRAWTTAGGGGIFWESRSNRHSKNACSNAPAAILAAWLYNEFGDEEDLEWAKRIYSWQKQYLFNSNTGAVYDNLNTTTNVTNRDWIFTYNQGTFLGAALELYKITGETSYINDAVKAADYTLAVLINTADNLLRSEGTGDGGLFKGIFIRYFTQLILSDGISDNARMRYISALKRHGEALWLEGTNKERVLFGPYWKTPPGATTGLTEHLSGCMLIEALALLDAKGML